MIGQLHAPSALSPEKEASSTHWIVGRMAPIDGINAVANKKKNFIVPGVISSPVVQSVA